MGNTLNDEIKEQVKKNVKNTLLDSKPTERLMAGTLMNASVGHHSGSSGYSGGMEEEEPLQG